MKRTFNIEELEKMLIAAKVNHLFDTDQDGDVDLKDLMKLDKDGSGTISMQEFMVGWQKATAEVAALDALKKEQADEREQLNRQVAEQAKAAEIAAAAAKSEEEAAAEEVVRRGGYGRYSGGVYEMPAEQVLFTVVNGIEVPMQLPSNANAQTKTTRPVPTLNLNLQNLTEGGDSTVAARPLHSLSTPRSPLSFASFGQEKTVLESPSSRQASYFLASTTPRRQVSDV